MSSKKSKIVCVMRARAAAYPLWKRGNEMDQTIAFLGGDARMRLLAQMMDAEGYDVLSLIHI